MGLALLGAAGCDRATTTGDWETFLDASSRCEPLTAEREVTTAVYGIWRIVDYEVAIQGREKGRCVVDFVAKAIDVEFPESTIQLLMAKGKSRAEIEEQIAETKRKQQDLVGERTTCAFPARRTRAYLTYWAQGAAPLARRESCRGPLLEGP